MSSSHLRIIFLLIMTSTMHLLHGGDQMFPIDELDRELTKGANAVVRESRTNITLTDDKVVTQEYYAVTLLNDSAKDFLDIQLSYKDGTSKITEFTVVGLNKDGLVKNEFKKKDLRDFSSGSEYSIISDYRVKYLDFPEIDFPFTIVVNSTTESKNTMHIPVWFPFDRTNVALQNSMVKLINNSSSDIRVYENNLEEFNIKKEEQFYYTAQSVKAQRLERYMKSPYVELPRVEFHVNDFKFEDHEGSASNWEELSRFFYEAFLEKSNDMDKELVKAEVSKYINSEDGVEAKIKGIYKYIQENTRYINVSLDDGGYKPLTTREVFDYKYGDCKALSFYMKSILDLYGIESNYVVVYADGEEQLSLNQEFTSTFPSNHIILNVPLEQDTVWLDCTSSINPYNYLGTFTDDRYVLEVKMNGGSLVKTPSYEDQSSKIEKSSIEIVNNNDIKVTSSVDYTGYYIDDAMYLADIDKEDIQSRFRKLRFSKLKEFKLEEYSQELDGENLKVTEQLSYTAKDFVETANEYLIIPIKQSNSDLPRIKSKKERIHSIHFERKISEELEYEYSVPKGYDLMAAIGGVSMQSKYGSYLKNISRVDETKLKITSTLIVNSGTYSEAEIKEIKSFLDQVKKEQNAEIILKKIEP